MNSSDKITTALQGIKALCEKATPGPWQADDVSHRFVWPQDTNNQANIIKIYTDNCENDQAFIAASRETMEKLVKALGLSLRTSDDLATAHLSKSFNPALFVHDRNVEISKILTSTSHE